MYKNEFINIYYIKNQTVVQSRQGVNEQYLVPQSQGGLSLLTLKKMINLRCTSTMQVMVWGKRKNQKSGILNQNLTHKIRDRALDFLFFVLFYTFSFYYLSRSYNLSLAYIYIYIYVHQSSLLGYTGSGFCSYIFLYLPICFCLASKFNRLFGLQYLSPYFLALILPELIGAVLQGYIQDHQYIYI